MQKSADTSSQRFLEVGLLKVVLDYCPLYQKTSRSWGLYFHLQKSWVSFFLCVFLTCSRLIHLVDMREISHIPNMWFFKWLQIFLEKLMSQITSKQVVFLQLKMWFLLKENSKWFLVSYKFCLFWNICIMPINC